MRLRRLGRLFGAEMGPSWMVSHAAYPTPIRWDDSTLRIYFIVRDAANRGCVAWLDVDAADPLQIRALAERPALLPGAAGAFDEAGVAIGSVARHGGALRLYYMGWPPAAGTKVRNEIGLAESTDPDGETFNRVGPGPVLALNPSDPYSLSYPFASQTSGGWQMIYGSHRGPGETNHDMHHTLTSATSADGLSWQPTGRDLVSPEAGEFALARPWLFERTGQDFMLFSIRRERYTVGVARRTTGDRWERTTSDLFGRSDESWDSEATCYASAIRVQDRDLVFYCGNGYGRTGFGVAEIE